MNRNEAIPMMKIICKILVIATFTIVCSGIQDMTLNSMDRGHTIARAACTWINGDERDYSWAVNYYNIQNLRRHTVRQ